MPEARDLLFLRHVLSQQVDGGGHPGRGTEPWTRVGIRLQDKK